MKKGFRPVTGKDTQQSSQKEEASDTKGEKMPLNKYVAHAGIASRRKAAAYIQAGQVAVNGVVVKEPGYKVAATDKVTYKGKPVRPEEKKIYLLLNKPKNYITTLQDERGRRTVMDLIGDEIKGRIFPIGRLDRNTTGLLVLTNDGELAQKLSHPSHRVKKIYKVLLDKPVTEDHLEAIRRGLELEDGKALVDSVNYVEGGNLQEVGIDLHIGRNRIVRRIFEHLGFEVLRLDRVYYAGLTKKDLPRGRYRHLTRQEVIMLKHFI